MNTSKHYIYKFSCESCNKKCENTNLPKGWNQYFVLPSLINRDLIVKRFYLCEKCEMVKRIIK